MDHTHSFDINELKCSETGPNYAPQAYVEGKDGENSVQLWFSAQPGTSHGELHELIEHMRNILASCQVKIHPRALSARR